MMNISLELFNEVMGESDYGVITYVKEYKVYPPRPNTLEYQRENWLVEKEFINIYELQHECKEWARDNNKLLTTIYYKDSVLVYVNFRHTLDLSAFNKGGNIIGYDGLIRCDTEPEAVFAACKWILDNKDKQ